MSEKYREGSSNVCSGCGYGITSHGPNWECPPWKQVDDHPSPIRDAEGIKPLRDEIAALRKENEELKAGTEDDTEVINKMFELVTGRWPDSVMAHSDILLKVGEQMDTFRSQLTAAITERDEARKALQWYAGHLRPEDRLNDNGDLAARVLSGENTQHKPGCSVFPKNLCDSFPAGPCDCGVSGEKKEGGV